MTVEDIVKLTTELRKLGVYRFKSGDLELEMTVELPTAARLMPDDEDERAKAIRAEIDRELHEAS